ncbi:MAG: DUF1611 domain-containing protein [Burkholderiaceae bacterium]
MTDLSMPEKILSGKCVIFAEGCFGRFTSKVAASFLRYRPDSCLGVIDTTQKGKTVQQVLGYGGDLPIVGHVDELLEGKPSVMIIGKGLHSAQLPEGWKPHILAAMGHGLHIVNSIHYRLSNDPDLARAAEINKVQIWETKQPPFLELNMARTLALDCFIVHTCGSDSNIGKKTTSLQITEEANRRGIRCGFAATGQTGMMISHNGIAIDGVPSDFVAGAVEKVVLDAAPGNDWVVLEGQGSLNHIGASGIALALLHGGLPHALVFCHRQGLERTKVWNTPLLPLHHLIRLNEELTVFERPAKVVAVSLNSADFSDADYEREARRLEDQLGLPVADPCRGGVGKIVDALEAYRATLSDNLHQARV